MPDTLAAVLDFLARRRADDAPILPQFGATKVLSWLGTSSDGRRPMMGVRRLVEVAPDPDETALHVTVAGALPRLPRAGDLVAVSLTQPSWFKGYQVKTFVAGDRMPEARLFGPRPGGTALFAQHVYTVHPSPATASFFERIPYAEVTEVARALSHAVVAVGTAANISPRFVYHHEARGGRLALFQGDAFMNKTYLNLQRSKATTHLVFDPVTLEGYAFEGRARELAAGDEPEGVRHIQAAFASAGMKPNRMYRVDVDRWTRLAA